jgi:hypothetical protein
MEEKIKELTEALTAIQDQLEKSIPKELHFDIVYHADSEEEIKGLLADPNTKVYGKAINDKGEPMFASIYESLGLGDPLSSVEVANIGAIWENLDKLRSGEQLSINNSHKGMLDLLREYCVEGDFGPIDTLKRILNEYNTFIEFRDGPKAKV